MMGYFAPSISYLGDQMFMQTRILLNAYQFPLWNNSFSRSQNGLRLYKSNFQPLLVVKTVNENLDFIKEEKPRYRWVKIGSDITEEQKQAIAQIPKKMEYRCQALLKQIICFSPERGSISLMLAAWVKSMNPERGDWLSVLKQLERVNHPLYLEVVEHALSEESFEANVRDYTKMIHFYAKQNMIQQAESTLLTMKNKGFFCDQVTLTTLIHMYSKAGNFNQAEESFEEMKLLGTPLDRRSYGSMVMACIRAGKLNRGESVLKEMEAKEVYAGKEVYKAMLRAFSMTSDSRGAQRVFNAIQLAGIVPDVKMCGLLINAYVIAGQTREAIVVFNNMRKAGLEPNDKCVALVLAAYEKEDKLKDALEFLLELEKDGIMIGKEASELLVKWFRKLGVVEEVGTVLRDYISRVPESVL